MMLHLLWYRIKQMKGLKKIMLLESIVFKITCTRYSKQINTYM